MSAKIRRWAGRVSAGIRGASQPARDRGATLAEYAMLLALIAAVSVGSLVFIGKTVSSTANNVGVQIASNGGTDPATQIVLAGGPIDNPATLSQGSQTTFSATIEDASGIAIFSGPDSTDKVTFTETSNAGTVTSSNNSPDAVAGVATNILTGANTGSVTVSASVTLQNGNTLTSNQMQFTVTAYSGALVFTSEPGGGPDGTTWALQPQVTVYKDAAHTVVDTSFVGSITLTIASTNAGGTPQLNCTANPQQVSAGIATFSGCYIIGQPGNYTLEASSYNGLSQGSNPFAITAGVPALLAFSNEPADATGGSSIPGPPEVSVEDSFQQVITSDNSTTITLSLGTNPGGGTLAGCTTAVTVTNGVAQFSNCSIDKPGTGYTLIASDTYAPDNTPKQVTPATSTSFNVTVGAASQLVFSTQPGGAMTGSSLSTPPAVTVEDAGGNVVTTDNASTIILTIGTNPGGGTLSGCTTAVPVTNGVATFPNCSINQPGTGYTLIASDTYAPDNTPTPVTPATSATFNITGAPAQLAFTIQPGGASQGVPFLNQPAVAIEDANGNIVTTDNTDAVALTFHPGYAPNGTTMTGCNSPLTVSAGVAQFAGCTVNNPSEFDYVTATSHGLPNQPSNLFDVAGAAAQIVFSTQPGGASGGSVFTQQPVVEVLDNANPIPNVVTSDNTSQITLTIRTNPAGGTLSGCTGAVTVTNGVATFSKCAIDNPGQGYRLLATDSTDGFTVVSDYFNVAGAPARIVFSTQPGQAVAGTAFGRQPVVEVLDTHDNLVTGDSTSSISLAIGANPGGGALSGCNSPLAVTNGVATFAGCKISAPGNPYTLTADDTSDNLNVTSDDFDVQAAPTQLAFVFQPGTANQGQNFPYGSAPGVAVEDAAGNTVTNDNTSNITLTITNGTGTSGAILTCTTNPLTVTNGVAYFGGYGTGCQINDAGTAYTLTATDTADGLPAVTSAPFNVVGTPTKLAFTVPPGTTVAGSDFTPDVQVSVEDQNGNVVTTDNTSNVTLAIGTNAGGNGTLLTCGYGHTAGVNNGVADFYNCSINHAGTGYTLTATDTPDNLTSATSAPFNITTKPTKLVFTQEPGNITAGSYFTPSITVAAETGAGVVTSDESTQVNLYLPGPGTVTCTGGQTVTVVNGTATFSNCTVDLAGTGYQLTADDTTDTGVADATSTAFNVTAGPVSQLVFSTQPGDATVNDLLTPQPGVSVEDQYGNVVATDHTSSIALTIDNNPGGGSLSSACAAPLTVTNGVATFAGCSISSAGIGYSLTATDKTETVPTVNSNNFDVTPAPTQLVFTQEPGNITAGNNFAPSIRVAAENAGGVLTTDQSTTITLSVQTGPGAIACDNDTVQVNNGVAIFTGCTITTAGTGYVLAATDSADALTATSNPSFTVTAGPRYQIVFTSSPGAGSHTANLSPSPSASIEDQYGNVVTTDNDSSVTLSRRAVSGTGTLACTHLTVTATGGVVTWANCTLNAKGTYYLIATDNTDNSGFPFYTPFTADTPYFTLS